jgi:uncharacterized membrane protein YdjX (TVP38/TMEM64 family)
MNRGRWLLLVALVAAVAVFLAYGPDEQTVIRRSAEWREAARTDLFAALAVFFVAEVVLVALSVPVGIWMSVLAGFLFGVWVGTAVVAVGATVGAILAFLAARYVFAGALRRAAQSRPRLGRWLAAIDAGFRQRGAFYVVLLRLTPVFPFWVLNLGLGLTRIRLRDYWWATQLGILPMTVVIVNAGASLAEVTELRDVLSPRVLVALCLLPLVAFVLHRLARVPQKPGDEVVKS